MGLTGPLLKSRGVENSLHRVMYVLGRFGVSRQKIEDELNRYVDVTQACGCSPTFPITGVVLGRHPDLVSALSNRGVEFAIHGYVHNDYRTMARQQQDGQIRQAMSVFETAGIPFRGFRAPYLRSNSDTTGVLRHLGFLYDSSETLQWNVLNKEEFSLQSWKEYENVLAFYAPQSADSYLALPRSEDGIVEIPVSLPDDESLVDRLGTAGTEGIARTWSDVANRIYDRGELFVLQLHHERLSIARDALAAVLSQARRRDPPVWVATLAEIADWWKERQQSSFQIVRLDNGKYKVSARCSERATILVQNCSVDGGAPWWAPGYYRVDKREFIIDSLRPPVIGLAPDTNDAAVAFLRSEGFAVERDAASDCVGLHISNLKNFSRRNEKELSEAVSRASSPLIRFWRWPSGARSALAVTGDIDSITLRDFLWRLIEVRS